MRRRHKEQAPVLSAVDNIASRITHSHRENNSLQLRASHMFRPKMQLSYSPLQSLQSGQCLVAAPHRTELLKTLQG